MQLDCCCLKLEITLSDFSSFHLGTMRINRSAEENKWLVNIVIYHKLLRFFDDLRNTQ